jgi:outer membrane protein, heavy metal efflux system
VRGTAFWGVRRSGKENVSMHIQSTFGRGCGVSLLSVALSSGAAAQVPQPLSAQVTMTDAVRLTLEHNQTLRAQRLTIDQSKADEITAGLKPNPALSLGADGLTPFSPRQINLNFLRNTVSYTSGLSYTFERGGKRDKRISVAQLTTDVTSKNVLDLERQLRFQAEQAFVNALLAKSTLDLTREDLKNFSDVVVVNRARVSSGDLAEGELYKIELQQLQFEQDVSAAEISLIQAKAQLRQLMGFDTVPDDFDINGALTSSKVSFNLPDLERQALESRADFQAAQASVRLASETAALERGNKARDVSGDVGYTHTGPDNTVGVGVGFELPFHDRNQGNIARSDIAVRQATETEAAVRAAVLTDVTTARASVETNQKIVALYESGYLAKAKESLDITTYVYQRGAGTLFDLLDAERTYRATQLAYRQALADYMTTLRQLNFAVGKQVIP